VGDVSEMGTKRKPTKGVDAKLFARVKMSGASTQVAMEAAGYAPSCARRGWTQLNKKCKEQYALALNITLAELDGMGGRLTPEQRARVIRGKALKNIAEGTDESVGSMKLLGQDRDVNMFAPDSITGIFMLEMPAYLGKQLQSQVIERGFDSFGDAFPQDRGIGLTSAELAAMRAPILPAVIESETEQQETIRRATGKES
jgi:hypothetical protein